MNKKFNAAPLPFQGQKRRFTKQFKEALSAFPEDAVYVDLFGGSGLLAHIVKQKYPKAKVIWNDYDNFAKRLKAIPQTNALLTKLRPILKDLPRKERIPETTRKKVLEAIKLHETEYDYVDYITLSASLLFSAKYAVSYEQFAKETFYNRIKISDYECTGYLEDVERLSCDYKKLFEKYKSDRTVFLVDPPYLSTDTSTYGSNNYWRLRDYLDVLNVLDESRYFYFTSNKSQIVELCQWIETRTSFGNPFQGSTITTTETSLNRSASYTDIMMFK
ncbi:DNA adenine methylase [Pseudotamlana carrageenivorans]|uniref:site-specific DNA-methyltransferase (adenine-specific) n=1 Tax=Pseudotamlana carrageenivorans TaxID=2069432 RepID=A0A2I7SN96_9FLAO|nr:DNA adenine methylase [Tamlana carrageenivorans]AUS07353.1 DNA methyltransferase [Tamlana carrageenivorans]